MAEALSGTLDMTGEPEGSPQILGIAAADVNGGTHAFGAIMAALFKRQLTGKGCYIDIALSDCLFGYHEISFQQYILSRGTVTPRRSGTNLPSVVPYGIFRARDGFIAIAVASEPVWARLARAMGDVELVEKYPSNEVRVQKKREVLALVQAWVSSFKSAADVLEVLVRQEVPCGKLLSIPEVLEDPHVRARNMFVDVEVPVVGRTLLMNTPFKFDRWTAGPRGGPARLGQHTREVLCSRLGLPEAAFRELQGQGVVEVPAVE
jgi:CoA:oxalate CoA-transferase